MKRKLVMQLQGGAMSYCSRNYHQYSQIAIEFEWALEIQLKIWEEAWWRWAWEGWRRRRRTHRQEEAPRRCSTLCSRHLHRGCSAMGGLQISNLPSNTSLSLSLSDNASVKLGGQLNTFMDERGERQKVIKKNPCNVYLLGKKKKKNSGLCIYGGNKSLDMFLNMFV